MGEGAQARAGKCDYKLAGEPREKRDPDVLVPLKADGWQVLLRSDRAPAASLMRLLPGWDCRVSNPARFATTDQLACAAYCKSAWLSVALSAAWTVWPLCGPCLAYVAFAAISSLPRICVVRSNHLR
ncbi:hypothetical protein M8818_007316 [Zalaria obscura]|uniref:Uncharacterized protein n=1 Tax=Zalaria obscura TaxID=2024903 RepID=A0ACC3S306_9PEZI